jgi:hypothetical protein
MVAGDTCDDPPDQEAGLALAVAEAPPKPANGLKPVDCEDDALDVIDEVSD